MKPGVHVMPAAEYHALPFLSSGLARIILSQSPLHAWTASRLNPSYMEEESTQFDLGTAAHAMLLEGAEGIAVINPQDHQGPRGGIPKGWTNDSIRAARDAARAAGRTPVLTGQFAEIEAMVEAAQKAIADCPDLRGLTLADGTAEQVVIWEEPGGVWCRSRPDWMDHGRAVQISYKTTGASANPDEWVRTGLGIGFDLQEAFYLRGNRATGGPEDGVSLTLVQENSAPYACAWMALDPAFRAWSDERVEEAIELWRRCTAAGRWPGYAPRVHWLEPPGWAMARWEGRGPLALPPTGKMFSEDDLKDGIPL